jgi:hypothetical protein
VLAVEQYSVLVDLDWNEDAIQSDVVP